MKYTYHNNVWDGESIFVFGSNLAGRHGAGAAKYALKNCGAIYGQGVGRQGGSYAIPTKDQAVQALSLFSIKQYIFFFVEYAAQHPEKEFFVTALGTGLAGYKHKDIAPLFRESPTNCIFPIEWEAWLEQ